MTFDFGSRKEKSLYRKLARNHDVALYLGQTVNIQFRTGIADYQTQAEIDFLSPEKVFFWANGGWKLPAKTKQLIENHGYTIETEFNKLTEKEKQTLGAD